MQVVGLRTGISPDIGIDSCFQAHRVQTIRKRAKARGSIRCLCRRKDAGSNNHSVIGRAALEPPTVIEIDVDIAEP